MSAWLAVKGTYLFGANDSRSAAPELLRIGRDTLVLVGRVGSDDFAATARRTQGLDALAKVFLDEYDRVRALGGHYVLSYHSQVLATPTLVPSLAIVARRLMSDTAVWVAPLGDIAEWWRERAVARCARAYRGRRAEGRGSQPWRPRSPRSGRWRVDPRLEAGHRRRRPTAAERRTHGSRRVAAVAASNIENGERGSHIRRTRPASSGVSRIQDHSGRQTFLIRSRTRAKRRSSRTASKRGSHQTSAGADQRRKDSPSRH